MGLNLNLNSMGLNLNSMGLNCWVGTDGSELLGQKKSPSFDGLLLIGLLITEQEQQ